MVELEGITFGYGERGRLFDGLDLTLTPGNVYGLLRPQRRRQDDAAEAHVGATVPQSGQCPRRRRRGAPPHAGVSARAVLRAGGVSHAGAVGSRAGQALRGVLSPLRSRRHGALPGRAGGRSEPEHDHHVLRAEEEGAARLRRGQPVPASDTRRADQRARHSRQESVPPPARRRGGVAGQRSRHLRRAQHRLFNSVCADYRRVEAAFADADGNERSR